MKILYVIMVITTFVVSCNTKGEDQTKWILAFLAILIYGGFILFGPRMDEECGGALSRYLC